MTQRQLGSLLKLLRREGVTRYVDGAVTIELGAAKADTQDKQKKYYPPPGPDVSLAEDPSPPAADEEEMTDPHAWLQARYRAAAQSGET